MRFHERNLSSVGQTVSLASTHVATVQGADTEISKAELARIRAGLDAEIAQFRDRTLAARDFTYVFLAATYCKARVGGITRGCCRMLVRRLTLD